MLFLCVPTTSLRMHSLEAGKFGVLFPLSCDATVALSLPTKNDKLSENLSDSHPSFSGASLTAHVVYSQFEVALQHCLFYDSTVELVMNCIASNI